MLAIPSTINKIQTLVDNTLRIYLDTQELKAEDNAELFRNKGKLGWFVFKDAPITEQDLNLPEIEAEFKGEKTPAKRMRDIFYRIWEKTDRKIDADTYYYREVNKICDYLKEKHLN